MVYRESLSISPRLEWNATMELDEMSVYVSATVLHDDLGFDIIHDLQSHLKVKVFLNGTFQFFGSEKSDIYSK